MKIPDLDTWCLGNVDCNWIAWRDSDYHNPEDVKKFLNFIDIHSSTDESKHFREYGYDELQPRISEMGGWANFKHWVLVTSKEESSLLTHCLAILSTLNVELNRFGSIANSVAQKMKEEETKLSDFFKAIHEKRK